MNRTTNISRFAALAVLGLLPFVGYSQNNRGKDDSLKTEHVVIIREFEPVIKDADKINIPPVLRPVEVPTPTFKYDMVPVSKEIVYQPDTIKAARLKGEPLSKLYRNYLKLGIGNYLNNFGQFNFNSLRSRNWQWGLGVYHFGSAGGIKDLPDNSFSHQKINAYGKKILRAHIIDAEGGYERDRFQYYGFSKTYLDFFPLESPEYNDDIIGQTYNRIYGRVGLQSFYSDSATLNYDIDLYYRHFLNRDNDTKEDNIKVSAVLDRFFGKQQGRLFLGVDYNKPSTNQANPLIKYKANTLIEGIVTVKFNGEKWQLEAGFNTTMDIEGPAQFYIYPVVEFRYDVYRNLIIPYAGVTGGMQRNTFSSLSATNPYVDRLINIRNSSKQYDAFVGIRGAYSSSISYNLKASIENVRDFAMYVPYSSGFLGSDLLPFEPENRFVTLYDTVRTITVSAEVSYVRDKKWDVLFHFDYFNYKAKNQPKVWHMPTIKTGIEARYNLRSKIVVKGSINYWSKRYTRTEYADGAELLATDVYGRKLDGFVDLNLGAEYRFTPRWSAYIDINNILSKKYEIWGNYKVQGINVLAGVTFGFTAK